MWYIEIAQQNMNNFLQFLCNKIKIMNREMLELYDLWKESKMLH